MACVVCRRAAPALDRQPFAHDALTCVARARAYDGSVKRSCGPLRAMSDPFWREVVVSRMVAVAGGYGGAAQTVDKRFFMRAE